MTASVADFRLFPETETTVGGTSVRGTFEIDDRERYLRQELIEVEAGTSLARGGSELETLLFVASGVGEFSVGATHELTTGTAARIPAGQRYELRAHEDRLVIVSVLVRAAEAAPLEPTTVSLSDQEADAATASREYRMLFGPLNGCLSATQFVGYIPPGRAPDHYHEYDEVIFVLDGSGLVHVGDESTPAAFGTCIRLPARVVHSVENVGSEPLTVLGVFCPAGSPAAAFYPDGTPAATAAADD